MFPIKDDQPRYSTPYVNGFLIALNILVYLFQSSLDPRSYELFARQFGVVPSHLAALLAGSPKYSLGAIIVPFFTSMFLHAGWMHVLGNMWYLYVLPGAFPISGVLRAVRVDCHVDASRDIPVLEPAYRRSKRSDCGYPRSVLHSVSAGASADMVLCVCALSSRVDCVRRIFRVELLFGSGGAVHRADGTGCGRSCGLGARGRVCVGDGDGQAFSGAESQDALRVPVGWGKEIPTSRANDAREMGHPLSQ